MMTLKEMREKTKDELLAEIKSRKDELLRLRFRKVTDVIENPSVVREIRKNIARLKTVLRNQEIKALVAGENKDEKRQVAQKK
ncbi:MAG: 50S ribosomal protein L29 [Planctomycetes bacterium]|nr:50S ribosomal protein L29 [Planctomycetota bacterium]